MIKKVYNSSHKQIGEIQEEEEYISIQHFKKPELLITDTELLLQLKDKENWRDKGLVTRLYDEFFLTIGEIAAIFERPYSNINKVFRECDIKTTKAAGRRNSRYGKPCPLSVKQAVSKALKGKTGWSKGIPKPKDQREKISQTLKEKYASGELKVNAEKLKEAWKRGAYKNVDFLQGIAGIFYSHKEKTFIQFRSLLELSFLLRIEEDSSIVTFEYEPITIVMDNGRNYTPDFLLNGKDLIELKSKKFISHDKKILDKVQYKVKQAEQFCKNNSLNYRIIYDEDLGFKTDHFKRYLNNHLEVLKKYHISFFQPERVGHQVTEWQKVSALIILSGIKNPA